MHVMIFIKMLGPELANNIDCTNVDIKFDEYIKYINKEKNREFGQTTTENKKFGMA